MEPFDGKALITWFAHYRNDVRPVIVEAIATASPDDIHRPGLIPGGNGDGSIFATFVHIVDVEESWLHEEILGKESQGGPDPERYRDFASVAAIWEQVDADWLAWLEGITNDELAAEFHRQNGRTHPLFAIPMHVFHHTSHHRAEVWAALTSLGLEPPELELVTWARERYERVSNPTEWVDDTSAP